MRMRRRKRWRSRGSFLTSVLVAGAGTCVPVASALVGGTAHLHTMSLSFIQTHGNCAGGRCGLAPFRRLSGPWASTWTIQRSFRTHSRMIKTGQLSIDDDDEKTG